MGGESKHMMTLLNTTPFPFTIRACPPALGSPDPPHVTETVFLPAFRLQDLCLTNSTLQRLSTEMLGRRDKLLVILHQQNPTIRTWTPAGMWVK